MQLVSPMPGSVASAMTYLSNAQDAAAKVSNNPYAVDTLDRLEAGIRDAKHAAAELFSAEPTSPYQDLVLARRLVIEGQLLLEHGVSAYGSAHGVDPMPNVKQFADGAFASFENALEILNND